MTCKYRCRHYTCKIEPRQFDCAYYKHASVGRAAGLSSSSTTASYTALLTKLHLSLISYSLALITSAFTRRFSHFSAGGLLLANVHPHIFAHGNIECPNYRNPKWRMCNLRTYLRQLWIQNSSLRNSILRNLILIQTTVARFVGTGGFVTSHSDGHTK